MKGLLSKLGFGAPNGEAAGPAKAVLAQIIDEMVESRRQENTGWEGVKSLKASARWCALMDEPAQQQVQVAMAALSVNKRGFGGSGGWEFWLRRDLNFAVARMILQKKSLQIGEDELTWLVTKAAQADHLEYQFPVPTVLGACERHLAGQPPAGGLRRALEGFAKRVQNARHATQAVRKMGMRATAMLDANAKGAAALPAGDFARKFSGWVGDNPDRVALAHHLSDAFDKSKPAKAWSVTGADLAQKVDGIWAQLADWMEQEVPDPEAPDMSLELLKALIWLAPPEMAQQIGRFCQVCYKKVPQIGARSVKLGNACLLALEAISPHPAAVAELSRLSRDIKYPSVRDQIAKRLARVADEVGTDIAALEDQSLPRFGLDQDGRRSQSIGGYSAVMQVSANETNLIWENAEGKALKSVPKQVRDEQSDLLKDLKTQQKDIENARKATIARLESGWVDGLKWDLADWQDLYDQHPIRRQIARSLIWLITDGPSAVSARPVNGGWVGPDGTVLQVSKAAQIELWHPLNSDPETVLQWRQNILQAGLTQPIKQAYREIYVLTDAERRTDVYSNRFAAHILRQHQFKALCDARGWRYSLMGAHFDGHNIPHRALPVQGLTAEYTVDIVEDGHAGDTGISSHVATDQVSFIDAEHNRVALTEVPPIVFSELMRDVDLFVAVASVANDPAWTDGGPEGRYGQYWREHAFGDLSQSAQSRKDLLSDILPSLAIAPQCRLEDKFLVVQGKLNDYAIHLGSSNIQIRPSNRYLCIVPGRSKAGPARLPFAGDGTFSIILSKAYMLVDDDKITDQTILSQMSR